MKKIILSLSFVCLMGSFSFAQDLNTEPAKLAEKVYNDAKKNLALKDISAAAKNLAELSKYENGKVFIVRNKDTKKDEYYYSQAEVDAAVAKGNYGKIKSQDLTQKYGILINSEVSTLANETLKSANEALKNKDYKKQHHNLSMCIILLKLWAYRMIYTNTKQPFRITMQTIMPIH
ncbi:Uncharacterised protein [Weeksella virosa]|uniref:hypothetical protein n=1 Tax=Weeksella virosa TaxID=1014 RepID=UPI000DFDF81E|nr:hypothetical protein [Weeksella virosa]SUP54363.1 Uncharacterised protein [Weeksella virosa]